MYDLNIPKVVLKKVGLGRKFSMIRYRDDWPVPEIRHPTQIKVRTRIAGICTSDIHQINVNLPYSASILARRENPFPFGHEVVADVVEVGDNVTDLSVGDRVTHSPVAPCEAYGFALCPSCRNGHYETCRTLAGMGDGSQIENEYGGRGQFGGFSGGGFSEYFVAFAKQFTRVPPSLPDEIAVLAEPLSVSLHAVARNRPQVNDKVVVIGGGVIGLMAVASLRVLAPECRTIAIAKYGFQAEAAKRLGADDVVSEQSRERLYERIAARTEGALFKPKRGRKIVYGDSGPDVIFDAVGTDSSLDDALHLVRSNGKIVIVGMGFGTTKRTDWALQVYKQLTIRGSMMHGIETLEGERFGTMERALKIMEEDQEKFRNLVTHRFKIEDFKSAFRCGERKAKENAIKVVFDLRQSY